MHIFQKMEVWVLEWYIKDGKEKNSGASYELFTTEEKALDKLLDEAVKILRHYPPFIFDKELAEIGKQKRFAYFGDDSNQDHTLTVRKCIGKIETSDRQSYPTHDAYYARRFETKDQKTFHLMSYGRGWHYVAKHGYVNSPETCIGTYVIENGEEDEFYELYAKYRLRESGESDVVED